MHLSTGGSAVIGKNEKLRKVSANAFQEAEPPKDRTRPLEWRRRFNYISLSLKHVEVINNCSVHDADFSLFGESEDIPAKRIKPKIEENISIAALVDDDKVRDRIYFAVEEKQEGSPSKWPFPTSSDQDKPGGLYSVEMPQGKKKVLLTPGMPSESGKSFPPGLYPGTAFRMNFPPGDDDLYFQLSLPEKQIHSIVASLRADENAAVEVGAYLLSFTFEVDDALREPYYPQDFVIEESALCFASSVGVKSLIGHHEVERALEQAEEPAAGQSLMHESEQRPESYAKQLNALVTAVWVLILVMAVHALLR